MKLVFVTQTLDPGHAALAQTLDHAGKRHGLVHREVGALPRQLR